MSGFRHETNIIDPFNVTGLRGNVLDKGDKRYEVLPTTKGGGSRVVQTSLRDVRGQRGEPLAQGGSGVTSSNARKIRGD